MFHRNSIYFPFGFGKFLQPVFPYSTEQQYHSKHVEMFHPGCLLENVVDTKGKLVHFFQTASLIEQWQAVRFEHCLCTFQTSFLNFSHSEIIVQIILVCLNIPELFFWPCWSLIWGDCRGAMGKNTQDHSSQSSELFNGLTSPITGYKLLIGLLKLSGQIWIITATSLDFHKGETDDYWQAL